MMVKVQRAIVLHDSILGLVYPRELSVLRVSIAKGGGPYLGVTNLAFDPILQAGEFRPATERDFEEFRVGFHPEYLETVEVPSWAKSE